MENVALLAPSLIPYEMTAGLSGRNVEINVWKDIVTHQRLFKIKPSPPVF